MPMKESFTTLIVRVLILLAVFICPVAASAQDGDTSSEREYVKLIEEGKTWEYILSYNTWSWYTFTAFQMHFDGTEVRNGIEYHKLVYCGDLTTWKSCEPWVDENERGDDWPERTPYEITNKPNDITAYFLMREEEGKVYLYVRDLIDGKNNPDDLFGFDNQYENQEISDEAILYDFTKQSGETIQEVFCNWMEHHQIYPYMPALWDYKDVYIKNISEIDLNGTLSIRQDCGEENWMWDWYSCIEGVGVIDRGFLPFIDCHPVSSNGGDGYYYLNRLFDDEGNIIYKENMLYCDVAKVIELLDVATPTLNLAIERTGDGLRAEGAEITLYDLSGRVITSGYESLSTTSLQPGVYVAKAQSSSGLSTLKLKVD